MKKINSNIQCPSCQKPLTPKTLSCDHCELTVSGNFALNEFYALSPEELHFLRIFIHFEGRIGDMEKALGVSYPTVKASLTKLKKALNLMDFSNDSKLARNEHVEHEVRKKGTSDSHNSLLDDLDKMKRGEMDYQDVLKKIKQSKE
ncbi:MAG: hypothetical protein A2381_03890 [Bdellovibrionales bacterium RIFOXYB1_FULL_37_110]|nr:MAG: hypothetical protein A2417_10000 [Bdellovibrionales bacterium RIFOXYC1_FULL_37_79]OFZ59067.1 MAG: hypothetical protein A2381_03890 [Bdellovibrionales bacterium RIFOXYB1_FULL_37_110]OFZ64074.1 MAG: hypothetical protein A2577_15010 [Bdellovibrionales bacterium RIFOXYD1_FULL_36_51]